MNPIAEEIKSYYGSSDTGASLYHYGVKMRSGRYPWGSGDNPYQHSGDWLSRVEELKQEGLSEVEIMKAMGYESTTDFRLIKRIASHEREAIKIRTAQDLSDKGLTPTEIGKQMGINESSVRSLLKDRSNTKLNSVINTKNILKEAVDEKGAIQVGLGVDTELGVSKTVLQEAVYMLELDGYYRNGISVPYATNSKKRMVVEVLAKPGTTDSELYKNLDKIKTINEYHSVDNGETFNKKVYPESMSSDKLLIRYGDEGGLAKDGVIEVRRGLDYLSLGNSHYAQSRILVDGSHYLKGMAIYSDDIPDGYDVVFNTNKHRGTPMGDVLKSIKTDNPDDPFGAYYTASGQTHYIGKDGKDHVSVVNKIKEEGDWDRQSNMLSSQFLAKQPQKLIKQQIDLTYADYLAEYDEIKSITNPTIRKHYLMEFASNCDSAAAHLKLKGFKDQSQKVILPCTTIKDDEVYAPSYSNGTKLALVRYPHAGTFEIPVVTVNNKNKSAKNTLGDIQDAIGISLRSAEQLSGADFDGDTVTAIPITASSSIQSRRCLKGLEGFSPIEAYPEVEGMKYLKKGRAANNEMGKISNLITDMTIQGAGDEDMVKAVKYSMVVIDAPKHKLNYKQAYIDYDIATLKKRWQKPDPVTGKGGASTIFSRKKQPYEVPERQGSGWVDAETGEMHYKNSGRTYIDKNGKVVPATTTLKALAAVSDAHQLTSGKEGTPKENLYADYSNNMKALANAARKEWKNSKGLIYSPEAAKAYKDEVDSLNAKYRLAALNKPKEKQAQIIANSRIKAKLPYYDAKADSKEIAKMRQHEQEKARQELGVDSSRNKIKEITDKEWEAIQAGAISDTQLNRILSCTDASALRERATPRNTKVMSLAQINKAKALKRSGYTYAEIAEKLGKNPTTIANALKG